MHDFRAAARDRVTSDPAKLMHCGKAAHDRVIAYLHMAGQRPVIREDNGVAHRAIVTDVTVSEKISAIADARLARPCRAAIHCNEFAKCIFVADLEGGRFAFILQVLCLLTDRAIGVEFVSRARAHRPCQRDMILQPASFSEHNIGMHDAIRTDDASRADLRARIDDRGRMNLRAAHLSRNVNISSASETTTSFTTQLHVALARRLPRDFVSSA